MTKMVIYLMRSTYFLLTWTLLLFLTTDPLGAVEDNGNFNNNTDPGSNIPNWTSGWPGTGSDGWNYVGQVNGASATYLGNGWVVTAAHVGSGNFTLGGTTYTLVPGSVSTINAGDPDLVFFQIASPPALPPLVLAQSAPVPLAASGPGNTVAFIGYGGGYGETWGLNTITGIDQPLSLAGHNSNDFVTADGTITDGSETATNNATLVTGDSGGGDFIFNASTSKWELAGINEATGVSSFFIQISTYVQQILNLTGLNAPPVITTGPAATSLLAGSSFSLTVGANGTNPLSYQWLKNGTNISGATSATFTNSSASPSDSGSYSVVVSNNIGSASSAATVSVAPLALSYLPATQVATIGQSSSYTITPQGIGPFIYQWCLNGTAITGATNSTFSIATVAATSGGNYSVLVSNAYGSVVSTSSQLVPVISQTTVESGQSATFTASPFGSGPFTYQWQFNGNNISSATSETYTMNGLVPSQSGLYTVLITSPSGTSSESFSLTIIANTGVEAPTLPNWGLAVLALLLAMVSLIRPTNVQFLR